jgi:Osteopetrosis-associated transmembrane protein 1 precursor
MHDNTTGESCKDKLLNRDRVEILEETFRSLEKLWTRSECNRKCCISGAKNAIIIYF